MTRSYAAALGMLFIPVLTGCDLSAGGDADVEAAAGLYEERKFSEAIPYLERALEKPLVVNTRSNVLTTIGNCYIELDEYEKSLEYHDRALKEDPTNHQAHVNKGVVYRLLGEYDRAAESYEKSLELAPDYAELHGSMGALALYQDDVEASIRHLERAIELDDTIAVAHSNLALAYATAGRFGEAEEELKKAVLRGYHRPEVIEERIEQLKVVSGVE